MRPSRLLAGALVAAAAVGAARATTVEPAPAGADAERGKGVVVGTYAEDPAGACFRCHGLDGAGQAESAFPRLAGQYAGYLYATLKDYAEGRRPNPIMQPIAQALTDQDMRDVAAYYAGRSGVPYGAAPETDPEIVAQGKELAQQGAPDQGISPCANCHGAEGTGMPPGFPYLAGQHARYIEDQLLLWKRDQRKSDESGIMRHIAGRMSYGQIRAAAQYYASLRPEDGAPGNQASRAAVGRSADARPSQ